MLFSYEKTMNFIRIYTTISDLLARIGGIIQILMLFAHIFVYCEHSLFLKNKILNSLYVFQKKEQIKPMFFKENNYFSFLIRNNTRTSRKPIKSSKLPLHFNRNLSKNLLDTNLQTDNELKDLIFLKDIYNS